MIRRLIAKEILMNLLSLRFSLAFLILVPLVVISVYVLCNDYAERKEDYDAKVTLHKQTAVTDRVGVDRPPAPMMALVGGAMVTTGNTASLSYYDAPRVRGGFDHTPVLYIFPRADYIFIVGMVMSLIALLFSYDAISGEREGGTLRLVMSNSIPRHVLLFSKWLGGYLSVLFPCTTALLFGMLILALHPAVHLTTVDWWVLLLLLITAWIYVALFLSVGILISAISPTTDNSAMRCLFIWLLFVLIIPNAAPYAAQRLVPTPSSQEMERKYDRIVADTAEARFRDHGEASKRLSNSEPLVESEEGWKRYEQAVTRIRDSIERIEYDHLTRQRDMLREVANSFQNRLQSQMRVGRILSYLSPYAVLSDVAMSLADTGGESQMAFLKRVREYEETYFEELYTRGEKIHYYYHVEDIPSFGLMALNLQERMRQSLPGMGLLIAFGILCFMTGYMLFLRQPV